VGEEVGVTCDVEGTLVGDAVEAGAPRVSVSHESTAEAQLQLPSEHQSPSH
jgi:hypothetical protein